MVCVLGLHRPVFAVLFPGVPVLRTLRALCGGCADLARRTPPSGRPVTRRVPFEALCSSGSSRGHFGISGLAGGMCAICGPSPAWGLSCHSESGPLCWTPRPPGVYTTHVLGRCVVFCPTCLMMLRSQLGPRIRISSRPIPRSLTTSSPRRALARGCGLELAARTCGHSCPHPESGPGSTYGRGHRWVAAAVADCNPTDFSSSGPGHRWLLRRWPTGTSHGECRSCSHRACGVADWLCFFGKGSAAVAD